MADGDTTTIDPNTGQPTGWMNDLTQAFSNPLVQGLMGLSAGFGQAAMPTRMRLPFGAVLGMGMGGFGQGIGNAYKMQQEQAAAQNQQLQNMVLRAQMPATLQEAAVRAQMLKDPAIMARLYGSGTGSPDPNAPQLPGQNPPAAPGTLPGGDSAPPLLVRNPSIKVAGDQANNPGNLMYAGQPGVIGRLPVIGGQTLAAFPDLVTGISANANQLMINQDLHGVNTVRDQVRQWVNKPDANLTSYTNDVAKALGVGPDDPVNFHDPAVLQKFILAQRPHESGPGGLDPAVVSAGVQRAVAARTASASTAPNQPPPTVPPSPFGGGAFAPTRSWFGAPGGGATTTDTGGPGVAAPGPQAQNNVNAILAGMQGAQRSLGNRAPGPLFAGPGVPSTGGGAGFGASAFGGSTAIAPPASSGAPQAAPVARPIVAPQAAPQPAGAPPAPGAAPVPSNQGDAMRLSLQYEQQARDLEAQQNLAKFLHLPVPGGDPALLRQKSMQYLDLANAGPKAFAGKAAELAAQTQYGGQAAAATAYGELPSKLAATGWMLTPTGMAPIPGGQADPAYVGAKKAAEEAQSINVDRQGNIYKGGNLVGRGPQMVPAWNPKTQQMEFTFTPGVGTGVSAGEPGGGGGSTGIATAPPPLQEHFMTERGKDLADQFNKVDTDAASAKESNYLFTNLRNDSQSWDMGGFANWKGDAKAYLSAIGHQFGMSDAALSDLDRSLGDYQTFIKSAGTLLRTAVHDTSSRAAAQEYTMIGQTMPTPTTSQQAFGQIADQWQALNDFKLAKQQFAAKYGTNPQQMNPDWNANVSPTAFLLNRMQQTPQGQADARAMFARMAQTPEGKQQMIHMQQEYRYARDAGLFGALP